MTVALDDTPATVADPPEVAAVAGMLRQLWPTMPERTARQHARTFVRIGERHHGPADAAAALRMGVLGSSRDEPVQLDPDTKIEIRGGLYLMTWNSDHDRRPGSASCPRWQDPSWQPGGAHHQSHTGNRGFYPGSARHGECTPCIKESRIRQAVYRLTDANETYCRSSYCESCARKLIGAPVVVPRFASPEEAQAWLDAQE